MHLVKVDGEVFPVSGGVLSTEFYQHVPLEGDMNYRDLKKRLKTATAPSEGLTITGYIDVDQMEATDSREFLSFGDYELLAKQERMSPELRAALDAFLQHNPELRHRVTINPFASYPPETHHLRLIGDDGVRYILSPWATRGSYSVSVFQKTSDVTPSGTPDE